MPSRPSIPTRASLLARLREGDDVDGWLEFFRTYRDLIRHFALKAGLTSEEADDVVQETAIGVARNLPGFRYDPATCSFKTWLLNLARWRILDALRRRRTPGAISPGAADPPGTDGGRTSGDSTVGPLIERIPDPQVPDFGVDWDEAWKRSLERAALERIRQSVDPVQFQIFDLYVLKERPAREVAARVGVGVARVYLAKQRVTARLRREVRRLEAIDRLPPLRTQLG